jgi:hypothetical protein
MKPNLRVVDPDYEHARDIARIEVARYKHQKRWTLQVPVQIQDVDGTIRKATREVDHPVNHTRFHLIKQRIYDWFFK